ncbi:histidine kinase [Malaciobacter molluscorum LMG 25693]|uniref:Histidine kinase n=1 Tax=Malaciobacter molluscorum LMG 25693 TaxID=870501 RepID=A0A2G1DG33_9BACT|nr:ABC transporter substrate binding protein [Malaciobacter molluscorum]AXX91110.1 PAS sensor-containing two-component system histidine kinase [Malaciobacter molluscorum LMG 25693]PHO17443.1 histidine kinase [Malaciobacter molluscorum LMG 25693]
MKKILILINLLFFSVCYAQTSTKEILLLHSYHKGYKWTDEISSAIEKEFASYNNINLTTVYMDTKRVSNKIYYEKLYELYKEEFKTRKFDVIIASDNSALEFLIEYQKRLFPNIPILFCGINYFDESILEKNGMKKYVSGVLEQVDLEKNFELISKIHPKLKKLIIINDKSRTGLIMKEDLEKIFPKYRKKFKIEYIDDMRMNELKKVVSKTDKNTALLFVLLFKDKTGKFFTYKQSLKQIKSLAHVPIYGLWDFYLNYGVIGGLLTSAQAQGEAVSKMAMKVLNGTDISQIPILKKSPNRYIFDYNELKKFDINIEKYLTNYKIINRPFSFYRKYKILVNITIITMVIFIILIILMKANINRRKKLQRALSNRLEFDKVLLDTIPNAIYYKNVDGKFIGCNLAFADLMQLPKHDIIGKTAFELFPEDIAIKNTQVDEKILKTLETDTSEMALHFSNKEIKYFILNKAVYKNIDGRIGGIVCIMDDITERVQQKQFLIQQSKLAEMGDMVAAIAHQWNEPLVELSAQVQDIQTSYLLNELKDCQVEEFVKDSMIQIQYMSRTLNDFRNFLKPSTKKVIFLIKKALDEINEIIGKQVFYSNIDMHFNYIDGEDLVIYGYENEFKQVLLNLINNAKNKIMENQSEKRGNIIINISKEQEYNIIEIIDDGGEIDEKIISSIFEPYFTTKTDGTGIGLYMAKVIVEDKMHGFIKVKNFEGNVVFTIKVPYKKD